MVHFLIPIWCLPKCFLVRENPAMTTLQKNSNLSFLIMSLIYISLQHFSLPNISFIHLFSISVFSMLHSTHQNICSSSKYLLHRDLFDSLAKYFLEYVLRGRRCSLAEWINDNHLAAIKYRIRGNKMNSRITIECPDIKSLPIRSQLWQNPSNGKLGRVLAPLLN